jgi:hypothetical protein
MYCNVTSYYMQFCYELVSIRVFTQSIINISLYLPTRIFRWWKGLFLNDDKSPLAGFDISHDTAQALGAALDQVMSAKSVTLLNFAHITTSWSLLGQGSFSKVYEGKYKHVPCALKVIYNLDLTTTEVKKAIVEATILSSARHPNIVSITLSPLHSCLQML